MLRLKVTRKKNALPNCYVPSPDEATLSPRMRPAASTQLLVWLSESNRNSAGVSSVSVCVCLCCLVCVATWTPSSRATPSLLRGCSDKVPEAAASVLGLSLVCVAWWLVGGRACWAADDFTGDGRAMGKRRESPLVRACPIVCMCAIWAHMSTCHAYAHVCA
jgi:hypothetical protein